MRIERFVEIIVRAFFERQRAFRRLANLRQQNSRSPNIDLAQTTQSLAPVHAWHEHIKDNQFWTMCLGFFKCTHTIRYDQHMEAGAFKKWREAVCDSGIIVSEKDCGTVMGHN